MKAQVKKFNGNYFLNIQNFLPEEILKGVLENCDELIEDYKKDPQYEVFPPEATWSILDKVDGEYVWDTLMERVRLGIVQYCKIADLNHKQIYLHSSWVTRYNGLPKDDPLAKNKELKVLLSFKITTLLPASTESTTNPPPLTK